MISDELKAVSKPVNFGQSVSSNKPQSQAKPLDNEKPKLETKLPIISLNITKVETKPIDLGTSIGENKPTDQGKPESPSKLSNGKPGIEGKPDGQGKPGGQGKPDGQTKPDETKTSTRDGHSGWFSRR